MSEDAAIAAGYSRAVTADNGRCLGLNLLIRPDADLDGIVRAWCRDEGEWLNVRGWLFTFDDDGEALPSCSH